MTSPDTRFQPFSKIARLSRDIVITEKIDGTNAQVAILPETLQDGTFMSDPFRLAWFSGPDASCWGVYAGSRNRWLIPEADNFGFAQWVLNNKLALRELGPGRHFGEWWGCGIQRGYGLKEKRFSLFNVNRWDEGLFRDGDNLRLERLRKENASRLKAGKTPNPCEPVLFCPAPACCHVVPVLFKGPFSTLEIDRVAARLWLYGSQASPGFHPAEGIVVYHTASGYLFKKTLENDGPKGGDGV